MLFYFSGAGNSLYIARKIAEHCNESLLSVANCLKEGKTEFNLKSDEKVGFVFPVYFWGLPSIIVDFFNKVDFKGYNGNYFYVVFTCGGSVGISDRKVSKILSKKNIKLSAAFSVLMPETYNIIFDFMNEPSEIPQIIDKADVSLKSILEKIDECESDKDLLIRGVMPHLLSFIAYPIYKYGRNTRKFYAGNSCVSCCLCAEICPLNIISMDNGKPKWSSGKCVQCLACLHHCPQKAIEYGKRTIGRRRYVNPRSI